MERSDARGSERTSHGPRGTSAETSGKEGERVRREGPHPESGEQELGEESPVFMWDKSGDPRREGRGKKTEDKKVQTLLRPEIPP